MLRTKKRAWARRAVLALSVLGAICFAVSASSYFRGCITQEWHDQHEEQDQKRPAVFSMVVGNANALTGCFGFAFEKNADTIIAFGTLVIGIFTLFLWGATQQTLQLAREEFLARHRPEIIVHSVEPSHDFDRDETESTTLVASVTYFNKGIAPATVIETRGDIANRGWPLRSNIDLPVISKLNRKIDSGLSGTVAIFSNVQHRAVKHLADDVESFVVCLGVVVYADDAGNVRRTGFCRRYDRHAKRWLRAEESEYEYAY